MFVVLLAIAVAFFPKVRKMTSENASRYFSGAYLAAADAIDRGDTVDLAKAVKGISINEPGREHITLMWYSIMKKQYGSVATLVKLGSNVEAQNVEGLGYPLYAAFRQKDVRLLAAMLDGGISVNMQDSDGSSLLQQALKNSDDPFTAVRLLVDRGADINHRDSIGGSALRDALVRNRPDIAIYLVQHGADINAHISNGASVAYAVQVSIDSLQPSAKQAAITNFTLDDKGRPVATETTPPPLGATPEGQELLRQYEQLRTMMIERGVKFPPDTPAQVRAQMLKDTNRGN
jgi:ankyrin repeat protein